MRCNVCGSGYRGLALDCDCTSYSDGTLRPTFDFTEKPRKVPGTEPKKPIEPTPPLSGRAPLVLEGEV